MDRIRERIRQTLGMTGQFGQRGQLRQTRQLGQVAQLGQVGQVGQLGQVGPMFPGMNVAEIINQQHLVIMGLISRVQAGDANTRRMLLPKLSQELLAHARAEEQTVYAALSRLPQIAVQEELEEAFIEHALIEVNLRRLSSTPADSPEWERRYNELDELLVVTLNHIVEEEEEHLPLLLNQVSSAQVEDITRSYVEAWRQAMMELQP